MRHGSVGAADEVGEFDRPERPATAEDRQVEVARLFGVDIEPEEG